jgi:hypothetical protein
MAVNESLTVFNLVDGVVDEFNDESGTDEAEGSNDNYVADSDFYINSSTPDGNPIGPYSAGFTTTSVTEPDTSTAGTNPTFGSGTFGNYTVPSCVTSLTVKAFGAGGSAGAPGGPATGGGGGFSTGTLAVTPGQTLYVSAGEGGTQQNLSGPNGRAFYNGGNTSGNTAPNNPGSGGGLTGVFTAAHPSLSTAPQAYIVAGSGGGGGSFLCGNNGGAGGGLTGDAGGQTTEQTTKQSFHPASPAPYDRGGGGGGDQEQGGQIGCDAGLYTSCGSSGALFQGGSGSKDGDCNATAGGGGGAGYYGGGGGAGAMGGTPTCYAGGGGGGSSFHGHPQVTCGSTEEAGPSFSAGGAADPDYVSCTSRGGCGPAARGTGDDGYVLLLACQAATAVSTTIVSEPFTSTSVATNARIVVFEENIDTPTLNTDIIASVSRDGTNFTNATLSDSGYVTGSSGQRILTGQADISGQPSGQSMRWKLQLANNQVKIHGVSLSWA